MKTNIEFICLSYRNADYLMEKKDITESFFYHSKGSSMEFFHRDTIQGCEADIINFDHLAAEAFHDDSSSQESMLMKAGSFFIETSAQAFVKNIPLSTFKLLGSKMDIHCQKNGIVAIRFLENGRIQYLIDLDRFINTFKESRQTT